MTVPRVYVQSMLLAVMCFGQLVTETASLRQALAASIPESGSDRRAEMKRGELRPSVQQLQPDHIQRSILQVLEREMAGKVQAIHAVVVDPLDPMKVPAGHIGLKVSPNGVQEGLGRRAFHVQVNINGESWQTIDAIADVSASIDAVVPTRVIQIDSLLEAEDLTIHRIKLTDLDHQLMTNVKDVIGKSAVRPLQTNNPIRLGMIKKPYAVRKGDRVSIEARHGGLSIQVVGLAKSNGELGQTTTVANVDSGKELRAKIVGPGAVRVEF